jgi:hypothetical protein
MKTLDQLQKEFGARLVKLNTGALGLRGGIHCTVKEVAGADPVMDFISSDDTLDRYNEVVTQAGWKLKNFLANPVVPDCHDYSSITKILGRDILPLEDQIQKGRLCCRCLFAVDNPLGLVAYKMSKGVFIRSQSVGFIPLEWVSGDSNDKPDRTYTEQELLEKSLVVVPANPGATIGAALKQGAVERADLKSLFDYLKQFCGEETDPAAPGGTSGAGVHDVRLLQLARGLHDVLKN